MLFGKKYFKKSIINYRYNCVLIIPGAYDVLLTAQRFFHRDIVLFDKRLIKNGIIRKLAEKQILKNLSRLLKITCFSLENDEFKCNRTIINEKKRKVNRLNA